MFKKIACVLVGVVATSSAFAVPPATLADLTAGISFADVSLAILAVTAALILIAVTWKGAQMVLYVLERNELDREAYEENEAREREYGR